MHRSRSPCKQSHHQLPAQLRLKPPPQTSSESPTSVTVLGHCWLGCRKGIRRVKNGGNGGRWALVSLDGVAPSQMVGVSASVNLPQYHKVQKFSSGTGSPGSSGKWAVKWLWWSVTETCLPLQQFKLTVLPAMASLNTQHQCHASVASVTQILSCQ